MFIHSSSSLENHTRFQTEMDEVCTRRFKPKQRKNPTPWEPGLGCTMSGYNPWLVDG